MDCCKSGHWQHPPSYLTLGNLHPFSDSWGKINVRLPSKSMIAGWDALACRPPSRIYKKGFLFMGKGYSICSGRPCKKSSHGGNRRGSSCSRFMGVLRLNTSKDCLYISHCQTNATDKKMVSGDSDSTLSQESFTKGTGTLLGAVLLIVGTSVGAGILAIPAKTAPAGFLPSAVTMVSCWLFLVVEALLLAEVNVVLLRRKAAKDKGNVRESDSISLWTMAEETLGRSGGLFAAITYLFLSYTIMVAYIAKSGDILSMLFHMSPATAALTFTFVFGLLIFLGGTKLLDYLNQYLTATLLGLFILIVAEGAAHGNGSGLEHVDWSRVPETCPVILFTLVYHDLTPVLCTYLDGDIFRIRLAIIYGSTIPLAIFLCWDAVALCLTSVSGGEDPLEFLMKLDGSWLSLVVEAFSFLAVTTSFIGTVLGFTEFFIEALARRTTNVEMLVPMETQFPTILRVLNDFFRIFGVRTESPGATLSSGVDSLGTKKTFLMWKEWWKRVGGVRATSYILVLVPPLAASLAVTDAFFTATDLAGGYGMTTLYGIFPPTMAWVLMSEQGQSERRTPFSKCKERLEVVIPGGRVGIAGVGACALALIIGQLITLSDTPPLP